MSEASFPTYKPCSNCGGIVPADSKFCKHCAFNFAEPVQPPADPVPDAISSPKKKKHILLVCGLVAVIAVMLAGAFIYKSRRVPASTPPAASQTMGVRAKQIEGKVLRGENITADDLGGLSAYELRVLRNVHFARYGRGYDRPGLGDYFVTCAWYKPDANYNDNLLTVADKANISLILAQENQVKAAEAAAAASATSAPIQSNTGSSFGSMFSAGLTTDKVQRAVDAMADWTRKGGTIRVVGVQELPQQNQARADLQFEDFLYNADDLGTPVSKDKMPPPPPDRNSPNFWSDLGNSITQKVRVTRYSGSGVAVLKHYNDGRWVLTQVQFGMHAVSGNREVR